MPKIMDANKFAALLARARAGTIAAKEREANDKLAQDMETNNVTHVDLSGTGINPDPVNAADIDETVEGIRELVSSISGLPGSGSEARDNAEGTKQRGVERAIILNAKQQEIKDLVLSGKSCVLIGAAGTGKTTCMRSITRALIDEKKLPTIKQSTKWLNAGTPGCAIVAFTRKATNNIRHAVVEELKKNTLTIHKLLEFAPVFYEIEDPNNAGNIKNTMRFEPQRNVNNPLPAELKLMVHEERSMEACELTQLVKNAMLHEYQEVSIGDIQQMPPTFGLAILGFRMLEYPIVELTEVYRQALNSPIIALAHKIIEGNPHDFAPTIELYDTVDGSGKPVKRKRATVLEQYNRSTPEGEVKLQIWQKSLSADLALITSVKQFCVWTDSGYYNPEDDVILNPFNKQFGTIEINKGIAQYLGTKREAIVHEVVAGFNKHYLAVGDRVLYDKEDAFIIDIARNSDYLGKQPAPASKMLDRWGTMQEKLSDAEKLQAQAEDSEMDLAAIEAFMSKVVEDAGDRVQAASHVVVIKYAFSEEEEVLDNAGQINNLLGGYCMTPDKAQGSEWQNVFIVMHQSHAVRNFRELLYTSITRAAKRLHFILEVDTLFKGVKSQRVQGNTLAEKAEFFKGKATEKEQQLQLKMDLEVKNAQLAVRNDRSSNGSVAGVVTISGQPAVRLADLVTPDMRAKCDEILCEEWDKAVAIFGEEPGIIPTLSYNISSGGALGYAFLHKDLIKLNPIWIIASFEKPELKDLVREVIVHELAHHIAWRLHRDPGHGVRWKLVMMKLGAKPDRLYTGPGLPPWLATKDKIVLEIFEKYKKQGQEVMDEEATIPNQDEGVT